MGGDTRNRSFGRGFAVSESMKLRALYRDGGPARHAWDGLECQGLLDWSEVDSDGNFRVAVPADTGEVHLLLAMRAHQPRIDPYGR